MNEDMIVFRDENGIPLIRIIFEHKRDIFKANGDLLEPFKKFLGKDKKGENVLSMVSFENSEEWENAKAKESKAFGVIK